MKGFNKNENNLKKNQINHNKRLVINPVDIRTRFRA